LSTKLFLRVSFTTFRFCVIVVVEDSLMNTTLQVIVMEGQLDVICNAGGK